MFSYCLPPVDALRRGSFCVTTSQHQHPPARVARLGRVISPQSGIAASSAPCATAVQGCQIGSHFPPNLATLARQHLPARVARLDQISLPNLATLGRQHPPARVARLGQISLPNLATLARQHRSSQCCQIGPDFPAQSGNPGTSASSRGSALQPGLPDWAREPGPIWQPWPHRRHLRTDRSARRRDAPVRSG